MPSQKVEQYFRSENPPALDVAQAPAEQENAKGAKHKKVKGKGHRVPGVEGAVIKYGAGGAFLSCAPDRFRIQNNRAGQRVDSVFEQQGRERSAGADKEYTLLA